MKYIAAIFILGNVTYIISFVRYNIEKKNNTAAVGALFLAFLIVILPIIIIFSE